MSQHTLTCDAIAAQTQLKHTCKRSNHWRFKFKCLRFWGFKPYIVSQTSSDTIAVREHIQRCNRCLAAIRSLPRFLQQTHRCKLHFFLYCWHPIYIRSSKLFASTAPDALSITMIIPRSRRRYLRQKMQTYIHTQTQARLLHYLCCCSESNTQIFTICDNLFNLFLVEANLSIRPHCA